MNTKRFKTQKEIDEILADKPETNEPFISLNSELTKEEIRIYQKAIQMYAQKHNKLLKDMTSADLVKVVKSLNNKK